MAQRKNIRKMKQKAKEKTVTDDPKGTHSRCQKQNEQRLRLRVKIHALERS